MSRLTLLFAKHPEPGKVKTRLAPALDPRRAAALALAMLEDLVERHCAEDAYRTELHVHPPERRDWFEQRFALEVRVQEGEDLGERLAAAFEGALGRARTVVVLGTDLPLLPRASVLEAHERLEAGADLVLAPDLGGGYGLVGLTRPAPRLFSAVPMSTSSMFARTLALAESLGLAAEVLAPVLDVDLPGDLERLRRELDLVEGFVPAPDFPDRTREFLDSLPADLHTPTERRQQP